MIMTEKILVINPGSTSTKLAVFSAGRQIWQEEITHSQKDLALFANIIEQLAWRQSLVLEAVEGAGFRLADFAALVARGGAGLDPLPGGTYYIDAAMVSDLRQAKNAEHASNLAGIIAYNLAEKYNLKALTVDPVSVDEFEPLARLAGLPELERRCQTHALNLKAMARQAAEFLKKDLRDTNQIGVHLGGGISVAALKGGKIVDANNANQAGPYSPERAGSLPVGDLIDYIYLKKPSHKEMKRRVVGQGGLLAYLGTNDAREVEERIEKGDKKAELIYRGMIYQIGKEIGKMAAVLHGSVDIIFLTGGLARSQYIVEKLQEMISFIAPVKVFPGAAEMASLAAGALRVLKGEEEAKDYDRERNALGVLINDHKF